MTNSDLESRTESVKRETDSNIQEVEGVLKQLGELELAEPNNLMVTLGLASVYSKLSVLYSDKASLVQGDSAVEAFDDSKAYFRDSQVHIGKIIGGEIMEPNKYLTAKEQFVSMMPNLAEVFAMFERNFNKALAVQRVNGLERELTQGALYLNDDQAFILARAIVGAVRYAKNDRDYGCGFKCTGTGEMGKIPITKLRKPEYLVLLEQQEKKVADILGKSKDPEQSLSYQIEIERFRKLRQFVNESPESTLFPVPEGETIAFALEIGSETDRKYADFINKFVRDKEVARLSPALAREYRQMNPWIIVSAPSLKIDTAIYQRVKREFPVLSYIDDPRAFQVLLGIAAERDGDRKVYTLLTGKEAGSMQRFNNAMQRIGGAFGLPNQFIDGK